MEMKRDRDENEKRERDENEKRQTERSTMKDAHLYPL